VAQTPNTVPFNPPVTYDEHWRNILSDLGSSAAPTDIKGILDAFDKALVNWRPASADLMLEAAGTLATTVPRRFVNGQGFGISSGVLYLEPVSLGNNVTVSNFNWLSGTTAAVAPTHQWMALFNSSLAMVAVSADATSTAIPANTVFTYPVANVAAGAATTYTTTAQGLYYVGLVVTTTTTQPTGTDFAAGVTTALDSVAPNAGGSSTGGQTTPQTFPFTAGTITADGSTLVYWLT
jgi:hypothetical protein